MDGAVKGLQGWIDCFEKASMKGVVRAGGVGDVGDIKENSALRKAYEMGKAL